MFQLPGSSHRVLKGGRFKGGGYKGSLDSETQKVGTSI